MKNFYKTKSGATMPDAAVIGPNEFAL